MLSGNNSYPIKQLIKRWESDAPSFLSKCRFLNHLPFEDYLNVLAKVDALLDPISMGSSTTALDAFGVGTPIITRQGDQARTRIASMYEIMGIKHAPVANTANDYIDYCIEINEDHHKKEQLSKEIRNNFYKVIDSNKKSVSQLTELVKKLSFKHE